MGKSHQHHSTTVSSPVWVSNLSPTNSVPFLRSGEFFKNARSSLTLSSILKNHISSRERGRRKTAFDTYDPVISPNSIVASFSFSAGAILVKASRIALLWKCVTPQSAHCHQK